MIRIHNKPWNRGLRGCGPACVTMLAALASWTHADVIINEIMFHPYQPYAVYTNLSEYVEIRNTGTAAVSLAGYRFDNGVDYAFATNQTLAAGAYLVVCRDVRAFTNAYPTVHNYVGPYGGGLDNGGERVTLSRFDGTNWVTADTFKYIDLPAADGAGKSIELVHPGFARLSDYICGSWAVSTASRGSPGAVNGANNTNAPPVIGEVQHDPPLPPAGSSITISARVAATDTDVLPDVDLLYRVDRNPKGTWNEMPMVDNGVNGDAIGYDGVYSARIPEFGDADFPAGTNVEFMIRATDDRSRTSTAPAENLAGVLSKPYTYLVPIGEDTGYTGEYTTYHILMTESNRVLLETRSVQSDVLLDSTLITANGEIFYNCGVRFRGGSSRNSQLGGYRVELPKGRSYDTYRELNFNHLNALNQYVGLALAEQLGYDCTGQEVDLSRVWLNGTLKNPNQGIYVRIEGYDGHIIGRNFTNTTGNLYKSDGDGVYNGDLSYTATLSEYQINSSGTAVYNYITTTNNPFTVYKEIQALCRAANRPEAELPGALATNMNWRQWARLYALQVCLANGESGWLDPYDTRGDEVRLYGDPGSKLFHLIPWDQDAAFSSDTSGIWLWNHTVVRNYLFHRPMVSDYAGDVLDIFATAMSPANLNALFDGMGSALPAGTRSSWLARAQNLKNSALSQMNTNLTVAASSTVAQGSLATIVSSGSVTFSGAAPMNYTAALKVDGTSATWTPWAVTNMQSSYSKWSTPSIALAPGPNTVVVETFNNGGSRLLRRELTVVNRTTYVNRSGTVSGNTTWDNSSGVIVLTAPVTVTSGATLTIASNTTVLVSAAGGIAVTSGTLDVRGSATAPVTFLPSDGASAWSLSAGAAGNRLSVSNAVLVGGYIVAAGARVDVQDCTLRNYTGASGIIQASAASPVTLRRCTLSAYSKASFNSCSTRVEDSLFTAMSDAGLEFVSGVATVLTSTVRSSTGAATDGIRLNSGANAWITGGLVRNVTGSGVYALGASTQARLLNTLLHAAGTGVRRDSPATVTVNHVTAGACTRGLNGAATVTNSVFWGNASSFTNGPATVGRCDIELTTTNAYPGTGNINRNPWFENATDVDYRLQAISPCNGAAGDGGNMGTTFPNGANPEAPTGLALANGLAGGTNTVLVAWVDRSDDETGFEIQHALEGSDWVTVGTAGTGATNYTDTTVLPNETYSFRVRAVHGRGESLYSGVETIVTSWAAYTQTLMDNLRFTEIMYNPAGDSDLEEFIEIKNISASLTLNMGGLYLDNDRYVFTNGATLGPQAFFVIARDRNAFHAKYGIYPNGVYRVDDKLDNAGETIWLKDTQGSTIIEATYDDGGDTDWYPTTDGSGYSLVSADANPGDADASQAAYWRASTNPGGSPGADDPAPPYGHILINEILTHTDPPLEDAIELYNAGTTSVDIAGWFLSDSASNLRKYQITSTPTVIPAGGYRVLYEGTSFNSNTSNPACFELSELGEDLFLSSSDGTNLTSYRAWVKFGASDNGVSFGRYTRSDGEVVFESMANRTFGMDSPASLAEFRTGTGAANSAPLVPTVVISEIMYNPAEGGKEFIELHNRTGAAVPLYDAAHPANTWKLGAAVDYTFPAGTSLAAGEYLVVAGSDPQQFRIAFGLTNPSVRVLGPYIGDLNNAGESLKLYKPGTPEPGGFVPYVLAERVQYNDKAPWPTAADNGGPSLERVDDAQYANDPTNWIAATYGGTPGAANNTSGLPSISFVDATGSGNETNRVLNVQVVIQPVATTGSVTVRYGITGGTATRNADYALTDGTLLFWPYDTQKTIPLTIKGDTTALEPDETVQITLSSPSSGARLGGNRVYTYTIHDTTLGTVATPTITPVSTNFVHSVLVSMSSATPNSAIYYTTDGSTPVVASKTVAGGYEVAENAQLYASPVSLTSSTRVKAAAVVGLYNASAVASRLFLEETRAWEYPPGTVIRWTGAGNNDAEQTGAIVGGNLVTNTFLHLGKSGTTYDAKYTALRFTNLGISPGTVVTNAYIQFTSSGTGSGIVTNKINVQDADNPSAFASSPGIKTLPLVTSTSVYWAPADWTAVGQSGMAQRTPQLAGLVQRIVDRPGWTSSNAIVFVLQRSVRTTSRPAYSYEGSTNNAPYLFLQYRIDEPPVNPDSDSDGMLDAWEIQYFGATNAVNGGPGDDWDGDGAANYHEYVAGTIPTDPLSIFALTQQGFDVSGWPKVWWQSVTSRTYAVYRSSSMVTGWGPRAVASNLTGHVSGTTTYTDTGMTNRPLFYKVNVTKPPD